MSSLVLDQYQALLRDHLVVTLFLTMLVGAGGNAGNQSAIKVIRGLVRWGGSCTCAAPCLPASLTWAQPDKLAVQATGALRQDAMYATLRQQTTVGLLLATGLAGKRLSFASAAGAVLARLTLVHCSGRLCEGVHHQLGSAGRCGHCLQARRSASVGC